jgi:PLP dependent protein
MSIPLSQAIQQVRERIRQACLRSGRRPEEVLLVAVSKTVSAERVEEALKAGLTHFGENYIQEAEKKIASLRQGTWHFIGHLQSNKAKQAVALFPMIETLDSLNLARELNRRALQAGKTIDVLVQVNEAGEDTKSGLSPDRVPTLLEESPDWTSLRIRGLMSIPPYDPEPEKSRPWYRSLSQWQQKWRQQFPNLELGHLSMGMSHDFEIAIEEGATIVRVGTAIFGARGT